MMVIKSPDFFGLIKTQILINKIDKKNLKIKALTNNQEVLQIKMLCLSVAVMPSIIFFIV